MSFNLVRNTNHAIIGFGVNTVTLGVCAFSVGLGYHHVGVLKDNYATDSKQKGNDVNRRGFFASLVGLVLAPLCVDDKKRATVTGLTVGYRPLTKQERHWVVARRITELCKTYKYKPSDWAKIKWTIEWPDAGETVLDAAIYRVGHKDSILKE